MFSLDLRFGLGLITVLIVAVLVGLIAAQSQSSSVAAPARHVVPTALPTPAPGHVNILPDPNNPDNALAAPSTITVQAGHPVVFTNRDTATHSLTAANGAFDTVLSPGESYTWTPKKTGRIEYSDYLSPNLHGAVEVVDFAVSG
jgi:plastocyanin